MYVVESQQTITAYYSITQIAYFDSKFVILVSRLQS